jgi:hypothetical protein
VKTTDMSWRLEDYDNDNNQRENDHALALLRLFIHDSLCVSGREVDGTCEDFANLLRGSFGEPASYTQLGLICQTFFQVPMF